MPLSMWCANDHVNRSPSSSVMHIVDLLCLRGAGDRARMEADVTEIEMRSLQAGDIVRGKTYGQAYIVTGNYGDHVTAVRSIEISNPIEWDIVRAVRPGIPE